MDNKNYVNNKAFSMFANSLILNAANRIAGRTVTAAVHLGTAAAEDQAPWVSGINGTIPVVAGDTNIDERANAEVAEAC